MQDSTAKCVLGYLSAVNSGTAGAVGRLAGSLADMWDLRLPRSGPCSVRAGG
jgi:hypothetical protein